MSAKPEGQLLKELMSLQSQHNFILATTSDAIITTDMAFNILSWNNAAETIYGWCADEMIGRSMRDFFPLKYHEQTDLVQAQLLKERSWSGDVSQIRKDGTVINVHVKANLIPAEDAQLARALIIVRDDTERNSHEHKLEKTLNTLELAVESAQLGIWTVDMTSDRLEWNDQMLDIHGLNRQEFQAHLHTFQSMIHPEDRDEFLHQQAEAFAGKPVRNFRYRVIRPSGEARHVEASALPIFNDAGEQVQLFGINLDITDSIKSSLQIQEHSEMMRHVHDAIISTDKDFNIVTWNQAAQRLYGWSAAEVVGKSIYEIMQGHYLNQERPEEVLASFLQNGHWQGEVVQRTRRGEDIYVQASVTALHDTSGQLVGAIAVNRDVSERILSETKLRESEARYRTLFESSTDGILIADASTQELLYANEALCQLFGYSPEKLKRRKLNDLFVAAQPPDIFTFSVQDLNDVTMEYEFPCIGQQGTIFYADISGSRMTIDGQACQVGFFRDVSDRRMLNTLQEKTDELLRFNNAMLHREERIIELKEEVNRLQRKLGQPKAYPEIWQDEDLIDNVEDRHDNG